MEKKAQKLLSELVEKAEMVINLLSESSMSQPQRDLKTKVSEVKVFLGQNPSSQNSPITSV